MNHCTASVFGLQIILQIHQLEQVVGVIDRQVAGVGVERMLNRRAQTIGKVCSVRETSGAYKAAEAQFKSALDSLPGNKLVSEGLLSAQQAAQTKSEGSHYIVKRMDALNQCIS